MSQWVTSCTRASSVPLPQRRPTACWVVLARVKPTGCGTWSFPSLWPFWDLVGSTVSSLGLSSTHTDVQNEKDVGVPQFQRMTVKVVRGPGACELSLRKDWDNRDCSAWRLTKGDPTALHSCLLGGYREDWAKFLSKVYCERSGNGHKLKNRHFQAGLGKSFSTRWVVTYWNSLPKEVVKSPWSYSTFGWPSHRATCSNWACFEQVVELYHPKLL